MAGLSLDPPALWLLVTFVVVAWLCVRQARRERR